MKGKITDIRTGESKLVDLTEAEKLEIEYFNNHIAPSIKFSANPEACKLLSEQLDYKCADVFLGKKEINDSFEELWSLMIDVCSGTSTWGEILNESSEVFSRIDRSL